MKKINISYNRKSTEDKKRQVQSIKSQIEINKISAQRNNELLDLTLKEEKSGKIPYKREEFGKLIQLIEEGKVNNIYVWKLDRLARNLLEGGMIIQYLQTGKINSIITPDKTFLPSDNVLVISVEFGIANQFSQDLSKNVKRGLSDKVKKGYRPGVAPIGYINEVFAIKGEKRILIDEEKSTKVRRLWDYALTGNYSIYKLVDIANDELNLRSRRGNRMSKTSVHTLLTNPFYYGDFEYKGKMYKGKHEPIVTKTEFLHMKKIFSDKGRPRGKNKEPDKYNGLIKCGECGYSIIPESIKTKFIKSTGKVKSYKYWRCSHKSVKYKCSQKSIEEKELENQIGDFLNSMTLDERFINWAMTYVRDYADQEIKTRSNLEDGLRMDLKTVQGQIDNLVKLMISQSNSDYSILSESEFRIEKERLTETKNTILDSINNMSIRQDDFVREIENDMQFATQLKEKFNLGDINTKKTILRTLGRTIKMRDKNLYIEGNLPFIQFRRVKEMVIDNPQWVELTPSNKEKDIEMFEEIRMIWSR